MTQRLHYIDALRSFAMLFGLVVHTGTLSDTRAFGIVSLASDHFRMATFFVISGFFTAMIGSRRSYGAFLAARAQALLVPLAVGLVLLVPLTNWLVYLWHTGPVGFASYLSGERPLPAQFSAHSWHLHLWFLVSLFTYVVASPLIYSFWDNPLGLAVLKCLAKNKFLTVPLLGMIAAAGEIVARLIWRLTLEDALAIGPFGWLPRATLGYCIYFVLGMAAFIHRPFFEAMHRISFSTFAIGLGLYVLLSKLPSGLPQPVYTIIQITAEEVITTAAFCTLFVVFRRFLSGERIWVARISASVYTIYLFHFTLIYLLALALRPFFENIYLLSSCVLLGTLILGYVLHCKLIAKVPALSWLFNGKYRRTLPLDVQRSYPHGASEAGQKPHPAVRSARRRVFPSRWR